MFFIHEYQNAIEVKRNWLNDHNLPLRQCYIKWQAPYIFLIQTPIFFLLIVQVRGVRPMPLLEMANLFNSCHLMVCPGLVSASSFHSHLYLSII